jgi:YidC/Oxa1 family membrane protein insertase
MNTRQLITGLLLAAAVFLAYQFLVPAPRPPQPTSRPTGTEAAPTVPTSGPGAAAAPSGAGSAAAGAPQPATATAPQREFYFTEGPTREPVTVGGRPDDALEVTLTPRGAGVESMRITQRRKGRYEYRADAKSEKPYQILDPLFRDPDELVSFATHEILIRERDNQRWALDGLIWTIAESSAERAVFTTTLHAPDGDEELLRLSKTYELQPGRPLLQLTLTLANLSPQPLTVTVQQDGPLGIHHEAEVYDMRRLIAVQRESDALKLAKAVQRSELEKKAEQKETVRLFPPPSGQPTFAWTALTNRFFGVFMRPLADGATVPNFVQVVEGTVALPGPDTKQGDLLARMVSQPVHVAPAGQAQQRFEIYAGPKDNGVLESVNPDFVDKTKVGYSLAYAADTRCCTFEPLPQIMMGLLHVIQFAVRNYGIAIIVLVLIVRTILHPLSVYQQKQMFRVQDGMARLQPKLEALKEQYKNDKVRLNQETMKLYGEEGVNPAAGLIGMLPLAIQMPILVALWSALNADIRLRHAAFDGWWITDLAAPDALLTFDPPVSIPILAYIPWIGAAFRGFTALNLLPILMGISMWLQQKYMPKPGLQAKLDAAKKHPPRERKPGQPSAEDQLRQQQMMGYMMTILMPLMFYSMPSGLNLYWMATNVFGIFESLVIRKHLQEEKVRREREGPKPPSARRPGLFGRLVKRLAEQAEEIQRKADQLGDPNRSPKSATDERTKRP